MAIGREALRDPNFARNAEQALGAALQDAPYGNWVPQIGWWLNGRERKFRRLGAWSNGEDVAA